MNANNFDGWATNQPLPCGGFTWYDPDQVAVDLILNVPDDFLVGYIFELNLYFHTA